MTNNVHSQGFVRSWNCFTPVSFGGHNFNRFLNLIPQYTAQTKSNIHANMGQKEERDSDILWSSYALSITSRSMSCPHVTEDHNTLFLVIFHKLWNFRKQTMAQIDRGDKKKSTKIRKGNKKQEVRYDILRGLSDTETFLPQ